MGTGIAQGIGIAIGLALAPVLIAALPALPFVAAAAVIAGGIAAALLLPSAVGKVAGAMLGLFVRGHVELAKFLIKLPQALLEPFIKGIVDYVKVLGPAVGKLFQTIIEGDWGGAFKAGLKLLGIIFTDWQGILLRAVGEALGNVARNFADMFMEILGQTEISWSAIGLAFERAGGAISEFFGRWIGEFVQNFLDMFTRMSGITQKQLQAIVDWFASLPGRIQEAVGDLGSTLWQAGYDLVMGFWRGILSLKDWLADQIANFFGSLIPGWAKKFLGIKSPSSVFAVIGRQSAEGYIAGFATGISGFKLALPSLQSPAYVGGSVAGAATPIAGGYGPVSVNISVSGGGERMAREVAERVYWELRNTYGRQQVLGLQPGYGRDVRLA